MHKKSIALTLCIAIGITLGGCGGCNPSETNPGNTYPKSAYVVDLDYETDTVTVEDSTGNLWGFYGCENYTKGDIVAMTMNNNGTPENIYDDKIISVSFSGWWMDE